MELPNAVFILGESAYGQLDPLDKKKMNRPSGALNGTLMLIERHCFSWTQTHSCYTFNTKQEAFPDKQN